MSMSKAVSRPSARAVSAQARAKRQWYVYLLVCRNGKIYTGIALDVAERYAQHVAGTGARYTRANPPQRLLVKFRCRDQSDASKLEYAIKRLSASDKHELAGKTTTDLRRAIRRVAR